jgi:TolB-like protein
MTRGVGLIAAALALVRAPALRAQCPDGTPPPCRVERPAPPPASIAVLYFDNLSRDSATVYLADGITEEIISRLGQVQRLNVKSRYAVRRFRGLADPDLGAMGRSLGVLHLVTGSLERAGPRVRVRVELVRAASGQHVWGETFDRPDSDVLAIEDEIAQAVAGEVIGRLVPSERRALTTAPTRSPEAYDHYLKGNFYLSRRTSEADGHRALVEYRAALRLDPTFAAAYGRLGLVYGIYASWPWPYPGLTHDSLSALGLAAANRAIALDSSGVDGWLARGFLLISSPTTPEGWRGFSLNPAMNATDLGCTATNCNQAAFIALSRAVVLDPRNAEVWYQYGRVNHVSGRLTQADSAFERSLALDPDHAVTAWLLGDAYLLEHRPAAALQMLDSAIALGRRDVSVHSLRLQARLATRDTSGALADLEYIGGLLRPVLPADSIADVFYGSMQVLVTAARGDSSAARIQLDSLLQRHPPDGILLGTMLMHLAAAHVVVGATDRGLALLQRVPRANRGLWIGLMNPVWDPVRADPRFRQIEEAAQALRPTLEVTER